MYLKIGERVEIFHDPLTELKSQGLAEIISIESVYSSYIDSYTYVIALCQVLFDNKKHPLRREIVIANYF